MNANEVIANRAIEIAGGILGTKAPVHPNDHVNLSQSSNDVFPSAIHIAVVLELHRVLFPTIGRLHSALVSKSTQFADVLKVGRTHLQDAVPLTFGQEISGWASLVERGLERVRGALPGLYELALGGTAVGNGLNAHPQFGERVAQIIAELTGFPFVSHPNKFAALSSHDEVAAASGALRVLAGSLMKVANDIRWLASGPRCGLGELQLPANEPGSSIMPGKVNPTQCEAMAMAAVQVFGNDAVVAFANSQGNFELNVFKPVIAHNTLSSIRLLSCVCARFVDYCIDGLDVDRIRTSELLEHSLVMATVLVPKIGYDQAAKLSQLAVAGNLSLREANRRMGLMSDAEFQRLTQPAP
jgi:fumarate hydratase class II